MFTSLIRITAFSIVFTFVNTAFCSNSSLENRLLKIAEGFSQKYLLLDSHIDWPTAALHTNSDITKKLKSSDFDYYRSKQGGLNAVLSVIWISPEYNLQQSRAMVDSQYAIIQEAANNSNISLARTPGEVRANFYNNKLSIPISLENGSPIGNDIEYISKLKEMGVTYITLSHSKANQICDANFDTNIVWNGLSPFGYQVVEEMNRLGIMIDISHSTDSTVFQVLRHSKAPIIASHSNTRFLIPGFERNLPDTLIKAIAAKDGVIMVNFGSGFIDSVCHKNWWDLYEWSDSSGISLYTPEGEAYVNELGKKIKLHSNSKELADHIDHIVNIAGIDHVGFGSDFDGVGPSLPSDLPDVSAYPSIISELLLRGYSEKDIRKIMSENFLRVWDKTLKLSESEQQL